MMTALIWVITLLCDQVADPAAEAKKELAALQGIWRMIGIEDVGNALSPEDAYREEEFWTFQGDSLTIRSGGKVVCEFTVILNPGGQKGAIDLKHKAGQYQGKTCHGIYSLERDTLKVCTFSKLRADEPEERPNVFSTK